ncbi:MAG: hypothetical protein IPM54_06900 [Polyangiaceae bacterium]|nr:hypothetical protein [Polyangiaceae bacterium]
MSQLSFAYVPQAGFSSFGATLSSNPWALVDASAYDDPAKPLWDAPMLVVIKVRMKRSVHGLLVAIAGAGGAKGCDRVWDGCQKQLNGMLGVFAASNDSVKRDAATRLQKTLLLGAGEGQTQLRYQEEVDFGRKQVALVSHGQGAADVALLGLSPMMTEIAAATEALAAVIGHGTTTAPPHMRRAKATAACSMTFGWAAESLEWIIEHGGNAPEREIAMAMHASLKDLVERYAVLAKPTQSTEAPPPSVH